MLCSEQTEHEQKMRHLIQTFKTLQDIGRHVSRKIQEETKSKDVPAADDLSFKQSPSVASASAEEWGDLGSVTMGKSESVTTREDEGSEAGTKAHEMKNMEPDAELEAVINSIDLEGESFMKLVFHWTTLNTFGPNGILRESVMNT